MDNDKAQEHISDVTGEGVSNCCGAKVYSPSGDWAICFDCKEHCDIVEEETEEPITVMDSFRKVQESAKKLEQLISEPIHLYGTERKNS